MFRLKLKAVKSFNIIIFAKTKFAALDWSDLSYFLTDDKAEILAVCLSKLHWALVC